MLFERSVHAVLLYEELRLDDFLGLEDRSVAAEKLTGTRPAIEIANIRPRALSNQVG